MERYPVEFSVRGRWLRWLVVSIYPDGIERRVAGPFLRWRTAARLERAFTQHYRNGFDMARDKAYA